ncbi:MAG: quinone-dependent dihydroorotate dehydrogenase [Proteobacteria bacterium]|nr:quinone-dependent dihydroorotate dehydrogenase [Pseudomonadota bacterium]
MFSAGLDSAARRASGTAGRAGLRIDLLRLGADLLRCLPPNMAHKAAVKALRFGLLPPPPAFEDDVLKSRLWGMDFANPIGMAAGFDKNAEAANGLLGLGFGFVEVGTVTPDPQMGNPQPNLFRLEEDQAIINRLGFPSEGLAVFARNLARQKSRGAGIIGANLGINTGTKDPVADIVKLTATLGPIADYLVVNVSCPNTPGLVQWQTADRLAEIVGAARDTLASLAGHRPPLLVKIAPDLSDDDLAAVADVALSVGVDGLIAANTTIARPALLRSASAPEAGGLSGPALFEPATRVLSELYRLTGGALPIIGCGGVASGADAYAKIRAGASLVQLYTALIYGGPGLVREIKQSLAATLRADGFLSVADAVGADHR